MNARWIMGALALAGAALTAAAQTASLTSDTTGLNPAGGQIVLTVAVTFADEALVSLEAELPAGWSYVAGVGEPAVRPQAGARGPLLWDSPAAQSGSVNFSFTATYPPRSPRAAIRYAVVLRRAEGTTRIAPGPLAFGPPGAPVILQQPQSLWVVASTTAAGFNVVAGPGPLSYQWRKHGTPLSGATASFYGPTLAGLSDAGNYDVVVSNPVGSVVSEVATLTVLNLNVNPGQAPPIIDVPPSDTFAPAGGATVFSVLVFTNLAVEYQWLKDGTPLANATGASLVLPNVRPTDAAAYAVIVKNLSGSVTSRAARLTVGAAEASGVAPVIVTQPISHLVPAGTPVRLSVAAAGTPPLRYQWLRFGTPIAGATTATLDVDTTAFTIDGLYRAVVTNAVGAATSRGARITAPRGNIAPIPLAGLTEVKTTAGGSALFTAPNTGSPPLTYQWFKGDFPLPGATQSTLAFPQVIPSDAGVYRVEYSNPFGSGRAGGTLTVVPEPIGPSFVFQPSTIRVRVGVDRTATITANVVGTTPLAFQWLKNGRDLPGATAVPLVLPAVQAGDTGSYALRGSNAAGATTSSALTFTAMSSEYATIGVGPTGLPVIIQPPRATTVRQGARATFSVAAIAEFAPLAYQWRKSGAPIDGATAARYTVNEASATDAGDYAVVVWNSRGLVLSEAARLTVSGRSFAGSYLGSLVASDPARPPRPFALYVRDDHSAVYLGPYADGLKFTFDDSGHFFFNQPARSPSIAGVNAAFSLDGTIAADGKFSGTYLHPLSGTRATLTATRAPASGPTQALAGLYTVTSTASPSASGTLVVDSVGRAFASLIGPDRADLGAGTVDANGQIEITGVGATPISGSARAADGTVTANAALSAGGAPLSFAGGREGRPSPERLVNLSTRATTGTVDTNPLIAGFVLAGTEPRPVLVRAIGPTLAQFGVNGAASAVRLELFYGPTAIASNAGWDSGDRSTTVAIATTAQRVGAFVLPAGSKDAVLLTTLEPGAYTAVVTGANGATGVALIEVYDATDGPTAPERRIINLSTRAPTGGGDATLAAGFVVSGHVPQRVLIRGVGPGLAALGVPGALADPRLQLFAQAGVALAANDDWGSAGDATAITAAQRLVGAFALPTGSKDAVLLLSLAPGAYTAQLTGAGAATGVALVEVYEVP